MNLTINKEFNRNNVDEIATYFGTIIAELKKKADPVTGELDKDVYGTDYWDVEVEAYKDLNEEIHE